MMSSHQGEAGVKGHQRGGDPQRLCGRGERRALRDAGGAQHDLLLAAGRHRGQGGTGTSRQEVEPL